MVIHDGNQALIQPADMHSIQLLYSHITPQVCVMYAFKTSRISYKNMRIIYSRS